jgi:hypothetical protein
LRVAYPAAHSAGTLLPAALDYNSKERAIGEATRRDPGLSVWDRDRVSAAEVLRAVAPDPSKMLQRAVFRLSVADLAGVEDKEGGRPLSVARTEEEGRRAGHCSLLGLWQHRDAKLLKLRICALAEPEP